MSKPRKSKAASPKLSAFTEALAKLLVSDYDKQQQKKNILLLFDPGERDHLHELICSANDPQPVGYRKSLSESLRNLIAIPLAQLQEKSSIEAGYRFSEKIENAATLLSLSEGMPLDKAAAIRIADNLKSAWTEFIADASAYRQYHDLPREVEAQQTISKQQSGRASKPRKRLDVTKAVIESYRDEFIAKNKGRSRGWMKSACIKFNITNDMLRTRMRKNKMSG